MAKAAAEEVVDVEVEEVDEGATGHYQLVKRVLWVCFALILVGLGYYEVSKDDVFPIREIRINGEFRNLNQVDFVPVVNQGISGNFFTLSVSTLYSQILALPWVEKVWIHKVWPDRINIDVREQKPVGYVVGKGVLNRNGEIFLKNSRKVKSRLPEFVLAESYQKQAVNAFLNFQQQLNTANLKIVKFEFDERKSQAILLENKVKIILGTEKTAQRLTRFLNVYENELKGKVKNIDSIDLRYTNGLSVKWKEVAIYLKPETGFNRRSV